MPKVSIITVAYNNLKGLQETFDSVTRQSTRDYEFIIIDGGSSDGSKEFLENNSAFIQYWVSEPDTGIYNGMNKGIKAATGEYVIFMNSGDVFSSDIMLEKCLPYLTGEDLIYGNAYYETPERKYEYFIPKKITLGTLLKEPICHQSAFFRRDFMLDNGCYREDYRISSDHIFNLQVFIRENVSQKYIPEFISVFDKTGISVVQNEKAQLEVQSFLAENLSDNLQEMALDYEEIKQFYNSPWGKAARKLKEKYYRLRYRK